MERLLFANIGWMKDYRGFMDGVDEIFGGGSFENKLKHEQFNFLPVEGYCYGYAQPNKNSISCGRIEPSYKGKDSIEGVTVVMVAPHPEGGSVIVGWYKNATVYSSPQKETSGKRGGFPYFFSAKAEDCTLIPPIQRQFEVPRGKGFIGQANVAFLDSKEPEVIKTRQEISKYISYYSATVGTKKKSKNKGHVDVGSREKIEKAAIDYVTATYKSKGYSVVSVEEENKGWDLEATKGKEVLKIEVKGRYFADVTALLSVNEFTKMKENKRSYRLCIVTNALLYNIELFTFLYSDGAWRLESDKDVILEIDEKVAAAVSIK